MSARLQPVVARAMKRALGVATAHAMKRALGVATAHAMKRALGATAALLVACAPDAPAAGQRPGTIWRGDVSYPGLPPIGVLFDVDVDQPRIIAAPNMGFGGGPLDAFRLDDTSASFRWSLNGDVYTCALAAQADGTLLGPCNSPQEPTIGVRMVPPDIVAPTGLARAMLEMSSVHWVRVDSGATTIWAAAEQRDRVLRDSVEVAARRAREDNARLFGDVARALPIDVFLVTDRAAMARVVRLPVAGWTDPMAATVALVGAGEHSVALRHELTHAISFNAWGAPHAGAPWLAEGVATWLAGECAGNDIHALAADLQRRGELIPVRALLDDFAGQPDVVAYLQSGSIVGYLLETYGADAFRRIWSGGTDGFGESAAALEQSWLRFIEARAPQQPIDWDAIRQGGCG